MKKIIAMLLALVMVLSLAACGGEKAPETTAPAGENTPVGDTTPVVETVPAELPVVALVVAGTFGDQAFYDNSRAGCQKLAEDFGITLKEIECNNEGHEQQIYNASDAADIVVLVGWEIGRAHV